MSTCGRSPSWKYANRFISRLISTNFGLQLDIRHTTFTGAQNYTFVRIQHGGGRNLVFVFGYISVVNEDIFVKLNGTLIDIGHFWKNSRWRRPLSQITFLAIIYHASLIIVKFGTMIDVGHSRITVVKDPTFIKFKTASAAILNLNFCLSNAIHSKKGLICEYVRIAVHTVTQQMFWKWYKLVRRHHSTVTVQTTELH